MQTGAGSTLLARGAGRAANISLAFMTGLLFFSARTLAAPPQIVSWSSNGGEPRNKDSDQDIMYLVRPGAAVEFAVTGDGSPGESFAWTVNKRDQGSDTAGFNFLVPAEKGIWEILATVTNAEGAARLEWVISTLEVGEAPTVFDTFSDGQLQNRIDTDPWGRRLPEWDVQGTWDSSAFDARTDNNTIWTPCPVTTGTWKFWYRYVNEPPRDNTNYGWNAFFINESNGNGLTANHPTNGNIWFDYDAEAQIGGNWPRVPHGYPYVNMVGVNIPDERDVGVNWHEVVLIRDQRGYLGLWFDSVFVEWTRDRNVDIADNTKFGLAGYKLAGYTVVFDRVEIYDGQVLLPTASVSYDQPNGMIVVNDVAVGLETIAAAVNDPTVFEYDPATRTAICHSDLFVKSGAELRLSDATLMIESGRRLLYEREAMFFFERATITSRGTEPWFWELSGSSVYTVMVLSVVDSILDNWGGFYGTGMNTLYLKNSRFTNLVGDMPIELSFRRPPTGEYLISGCTFQGKTGAEVLFLQGGDQFQQLQPKPYGLDIVDSVFENIQLFRHYDYPFYLSPGRPGGTANLINTRVATLGHNGSVYRFKHYLDVKVIDSDGKPVTGAKVTVTNEQDDLAHPAENLVRSWQFIMVGDQVSTSGEDYFEGQQSNWFKGLKDANDHPTTVTGPNGHTPLPSNIEETLVVTSAWEHDSGSVNYTHSVTAAKDDRTASLGGIVVDQDWYRLEPELPTRTIVCNIDSANCEIRESAVGDVTARVADGKTGAPIAKATVVVGTRTLRTDDAGECTIRMLEGDYNFTASAPGYAALSRDVQVVGSQTTVVDFPLHRPEDETMRLSRGAKSPLAAAVEGAKPVAVLQVAITGGAVAGTLEWLRLRLADLPTAQLAARTMTVSLFADDSGNGVIAPGAQPLAEVHEVDALAIGVVFAALGYEVPAAATRNLLVALTLEETGVQLGAGAFGGRLDWPCTAVMIGAALVVVLWFRKHDGSGRRRVAFFAAGLLLALWIGCGKFGYWALSGPRVTIENDADVRVTKAAGKELPVTGAPVESHPFRFRLGS